MKLLAGGEFAPITHSWGFLEAPLAAAGERLRQWRVSLRCKAAVRSSSGNLGTALSLLDPLETPWTKELLICTKSPWTAYFNNQWIGGDPFPPVSYLSQLLGCRGLIVQTFPDGSSGFYLTGAEQTDFLNVQRAVSALNDGDSRWVFSERGLHLPFEEAQRYVRLKVRERLDDEMLERYFAVFGIDLFSADFYGGEHRLFSMKQQGKQFSRISLASYRKGELPRRGVAFL